MNIKKTVLLFFILCASTLIYGQKINEVFNTMPETMLPGFSAANKTMLLIDTTASSIPYPLGSIELRDYSDDFLSLKTSSVGSMQLKLLSLINNSKIICVVKTVCGNFCDSDIQFYDTDWRILDKKPLIPLISEKLFLDTAKRENPDFGEAMAKVDIFPVSIVLYPDNEQLTLLYNITDYLSQKDAEMLMPYIRQQKITYIWNKSRFE